MRTVRLTSVVAGLALVLLLAGCAVTLPSGDVVEVPAEEWSYSAMTVGVEEDAAPEAETLVSEAEPVMFSLLPLLEGEPLRAQEIFTKVSSAVAHIATPDSTGSAVLIDHGYLVSAAHVVWPYESVRVVFPDGTEFEDLPVAAWDLMLDVALLGPIDPAETELVPLTFVDGTDMPVGSEVYLIGYPAEFEKYPQPSLGRGLISRMREWDTVGLSMFQVDADVSGGQSGGAMVNERGELVGITNYRFTDSNSPMVTSSADVVPALTAMLAGEPQTLVDRRPMAAPASSTHIGTLEDSASFDYYLFMANEGDEIDLSVVGIGDPMVSIANPYGELLGSSTTRAEQMSGVAATVYDRGPYLVQVTQPSSNRNSYTLTASHLLYRIEDPDDHKQLEIGETYLGSVNNLYDTDVFTIDLKAGEKIVVQAESLTIDPIVAISHVSRSRDDFAIDDDGGPTGLFGLNARVVFMAPEDGEYRVLVGDANDSAVGGYILTVSEGKRGDTLSETVIQNEYYLTSHGAFERYESADFPFTLLYPASYSVDSDCEDAAACYAGGSDYLMIFESSPSEFAPSERDPDLMLDMMKTGMASGLGEVTVLDRRTLTTHQGLDAKLESLTAYDGTAYVATFAFFHEEIGMFVGLFMTELGADSNLDIMEENVEFVFSTLHINDDEGLADDPIFHLEQGMVQAAKGYYRPALADLRFALLLDEELVEAYALRSVVHARMDNYEEALSDLGAALEIEPDSADLMERKAYLYWYQGDNDQALAEAEKLLELRPDYQEAHNLRSLIRASSGDYDGALEELASYEEMIEDDLPPFVLDTRAYVHLKFGAPDEALADYEEALADDFQVPASLLGAGVTYARLDRMEKALPLLRYGMEKYEEAEYEIVDPQLAELLTWAQEILEAEGG